MKSYVETCWDFLKEHGYITAWIIHVKTKTTCPHSVIRSIKEKYGKDILSFKDVKKTTTYTENGREFRETKTHRIWYLQGAEV